MLRGIMPTMDQTGFDRLRLELSVNAKNGVDFIVSATVVWLILGYIWTLPYTAYNLSILTFMAGSITIPLAFALSKVFKTSWKSPGNPLEPLGLWLNFAQLFYFPFLVLILLTEPKFFVMTYAIITGAHFFPYAWYYKSMAYALMAGALAVLATLLVSAWKTNSRAWRHARG